MDNRTCNVIMTMIILLPYLRDTVLQNGRCAGAQTGRNTRARAHVCLLRCRVTYCRDRPVVLRSPHSDPAGKRQFSRRYTTILCRLTVPGVIVVVADVNRFRLTKIAGEPCGG